MRHAFFSIAMGMLSASCYANDASVKRLTPDIVKTTFVKSSANNFCRLSFESSDARTVGTLKVSLYANYDYKKLNIRPFSINGNYFKQKDGVVITHYDGSPYFSNDDGLNYFPSEQLFDSNAEEQKLENTNAHIQSSLINTIFELGGAAWRMSVSSGKKNSEGEVVKSPFHFKLLTMNGAFESELLWEPNKVLQFVECSDSLIRDVKGPLIEPLREPDKILLCDEEKVDSVLRKNLPISTIRVYESEGLYVLEKLGVSRVYDLVSFDPAYHNLDVINNRLDAFLTIGIDPDVAKLADRLFGGYDAYARFNSISFLTGESSKVLTGYPFTKIELWSTPVEPFIRGCRLQ